MGNERYNLGYNMYVVICDSNTNDNLPYNINDNVNIINIADSNYKSDLTIWQKLRRNLSGNRDARHRYEENILDRYISKRLKPVISDIKPDLAITFSTDATRILHRDVRIKCPTITMQHGDPNIILDKLTSDTLAALNETSYIQVLMSSFIHESMNKTGLSKEKFVVIPNPIPQYKIPRKQKNKCIIYTSRVDDSKQQHLIIQSFAMLNEKYKDWKIEFWGDYTNTKKYYEYCQNLIKKYGLGKQIVFCGETSDVVSKLYYSKIYVIASIHEGFPLSLGEAMSSGLPAIGLKKCPAVNELIINGENGFLCDNTPYSMALSLEKLMCNEKLMSEMGYAAKEHMKQFSPNKVWNMWDSLIKTTLQKM